MSYSDECPSCIFNRGLTCLAFPDGIPEDIITGERSHKIGYPGDNGIIYIKKGDIEALQSLMDQAGGKNIRRDLSRVRERCEQTLKSI